MFLLIRACSSFSISTGVGFKRHQVEEEDLPRRKLRLAGLRLHGLVSSSPSSCCVEFLVFRVFTQDRPRIPAPWRWPLVQRGSTGAPRSAVIVSLTLVLTWFDCVHGRPSVTSMSGIMILGVCKHQTRGDKPGRAPPVPPCLELASGDFGLRSWPTARHRTIRWVRPVVSDPAGRNPCQVGLAEGQRRRGAVQPSH